MIYKVINIIRKKCSKSKRGTPTSDMHLKMIININCLPTSKGLYSIVVVTLFQRNPGWRTELSHPEARVLEKRIPKWTSTPFCFKATNHWSAHHIFNSLTHQKPDATPRIPKSSFKRWMARRVLKRAICRATSRAKDSMDGECLWDSQGVVRFDLMMAAPIPAPTPRQRVLWCFRNASSRYRYWDEPVPGARCGDVECQFAAVLPQARKPSKV